MKKLILIQHCQSRHHVDATVKEGRDRFNGLTPTGRKHAKLVAERLKQAIIDKNDVTFYSSDLQRAKETAKAISDAIGLEIHFDPGLREWMGDLEVDGYSKQLRKGMGNYSLFDWIPFLGGPTWREFHERVCLCMNSIERKASTEHVMIVSHGGTVSNIVAWWLNLKIDALSERTPFTGKPGCITVLVKNEHDNRVIEKLNDTAHLDENCLEI